MSFLCYLWGLVVDESRVVNLRCCMLGKKPSRISGELCLNHHSSNSLILPLDHSSGSSPSSVKSYLTFNFTIPFL